MSEIRIKIDLQAVNVHITNPSTEYKKINRSIKIRKFVVNILFSFFSNKVLHIFFTSLPRYSKHLFSHIFDFNSGHRVHHLIVNFSSLLFFFSYYLSFSLSLSSNLSFYLTAASLSFLSIFFIKLSVFRSTFLFSLPTNY